MAAVVVMMRLRCIVWRHVLGVHESTCGRELVVREIQHAQEPQLRDTFDRRDLVVRQIQLLQELMRAREVPHALDAIAAELGAP